MRVFVLTVSDRCATGEREDLSGPGLVKALEERGHEVKAMIVADEARMIADALIGAASEGFDLILTTGGTGLSDRDVTPEATEAVIEREIPGIAEAIRAESIRKTPHAMYSRGIAGTRDKSLIINLPGSPKGALESLAVFIDSIGHAVDIIHGIKADG